jgi:hypothetical protein
MKIRIATGDLKSEEQSLQMPADTVKYAGRDNNSIRDFNKTPHGVPSGALEYFVDASYDSRPVNGTDFTLRMSGDAFAISWVAVTGTCSTLTTPFPGSSNLNPAVPDGYVFVVKRISGAIVLQSASGQSAPPCQYSGFMTVYTNRSQVPSAIQIPFNWTADQVEQYFICNAGDVITVDFYAEPLTQLYIAAPANAYMTVEIYGNLLVKTGVPSQFEIANRRVNKPK